MTRPLIPGQPDPEQQKADINILLTALDDPDLYSVFGEIKTDPALPAVEPDTPTPPPTK
jgi:hypothetical protein